MLVRTAKLTLFPGNQVGIMSRRGKKTLRLIRIIREMESKRVSKQKVIEYLKKKGISKSAKIT